MVKKTVNIEIKENLQSLLEIKKIDFKYSNNYKLTKKDKTNRDNKNQNWDKNKNKFTQNSTITNINQL